MALNITPVNNHRQREKGVIVYPVYSRRAAGLSIGINLFPSKKTCLFNCPYCEVFPFNNDVVFSLEQMADDLRSVISAVRQQNIPIKDICFSGNGEPTLSPVFGSALKLAENIRTQMAPAAQLVIITNGTGLLQQQVFSLLTKTAQAAEANCLDIWLKLDAGTSDWYQKMNRCITPFEEHITKIKEFTSCTSVTIQTMLCTINGELPPESEVQAWETLVNQLAASSPGIRKVQLYGKARSAPEDPLASQAPAEYLESRAESLRCAFEKKGITVPVEVYL